MAREASTLVDTSHFLPFTGERFTDLLFSTPNMTGRRFHRTTEAVPRRPWKAKRFSASRPGKISIKRVREGCAQGTTRCFFHAFRCRKRHINIWHINNFSVTPVTDPPGRVPDILPAGHPDENAYIPWVPHTAHKLLTPGHRSGGPWPPGRETPPPSGQSPGKFVYVYVPFPFLSISIVRHPGRPVIPAPDLHSRAYSAANSLCPFTYFQDDGRGGLGSRGVTITTETVTTAETAKTATVALFCERNNFIQWGCWEEFSSSYDCARPQPSTG